MILDLDGTILSVNSFRLWTSYILRARFTHLDGKRRLRIASAALWALLLRRLRLSTHTRLKWRLQQLWQSAITGDGGENEVQLIKQLTQYVRPELIEILGAISNGEVDAVMATAAAGDYALGLGRKLGFAHVLATPVKRGIYDLDNRGQQKLESVRELIIRHGWQGRPLVLFTDHPEDLPLVRACQMVFWFGSSADLEFVAHAAPGVRVQAGYSNISNPATCLA